MATLQVRHVPEALLELLRQRAKGHRRSLSVEVVSLLTRALEETGRTPEQILAAIWARRRFKPAAVGAPSGVELLREDRRR